MSDLAIETAAFDAETKSVLVTFRSGEIVHQRSVNAITDADGSYDEPATAERIAEVSRGIAAKIACGAITTTADDLWPFGE